MTGIIKQIPKLQELFQNTINGELVSQTVIPLLPPGENYGSVMYKVDFKVKNNEKIKEYHAVAKCTPSNKITQELFNVQVTFKCEIAWYRIVVPTLKNFQRENGIEPVIDYFQNLIGARINLDPDHSDVVDGNAVILTENLKHLGYKNEDRHRGFDLKTSEAVLRDLASFHAIPLALKLRNETLFDNNIRLHFPKYTPKAEELEKIFSESYIGIFSHMESIPEISPFKDRIKRKMKKVQIFDSDFEPNEPWGTVCHNDFWLNNIMIKNDGDKIKTIILDLQTPCYRSIAVDVVFFLLTSVALDVIKINMDNLIEYYWTEFIKNLKKLNVDTRIFSHEEFLKELSTAVSDSQFLHAIYHTYMILMEKGNTDIDSSNENFKIEDMQKMKVAFNETHIKKYIWIVTECAKRNWI